MLYMIVGIDYQDSATKRLQARESHLARLHQLEAEARLIMAGPNPSSDAKDAGVSGSLIVAEFESLSAAKSWADADPYIEAGVYESVIVKPFKKVLPS